MTAITMAVESGWPAKGLVVLLLASLACLALRRASAAARHAMWAAALIGALVLPVLAAVVPTLELPVAVASQSTEHGVSTRAASSANGLLIAYAPSPAESASLDTAAGIEMPATSTRVAQRFNWSDLIGRLWLAGTVMLLVLYGWGVWRVRRLVLQSLPFPEPLGDALRNCAAELDLRRKTLGRLTDARLIPLTFGVFRPVIVLPAEAAAWPASRLRMVLLHELAHIRRHDCLVQCVCQLACAVHWFNPLAWFALARLRVEQERACDDAVLLRNTPADEYATELLNVTAGSARLGMASVVALAAGRAGRMERRIRDLLDVRRNRRPLSRRCAVATISAVAVTVSFVAALQRPALAVGDDNLSKQPTTPAANSDDAPPAAGAEPAAAPPVSADEVRDLIFKSSLQDVTEQDLTEAAIRGMLDSLHAPHSQLLVGDDLQPFLAEPMVGIGAQLKTVRDAIVVVTPLPNSPAFSAGLRAGDTILTIDGRPPADLTATVKAIRGPAGSNVRLKVRHTDGAEQDLVITCGSLALASVTGLYLSDTAEWEHWLSRDAGLGYVHITHFASGTQGELRRVLEQMHGLRGLVLDLRRCPGGLLPESLGIAELFIKDRALLTIQGKQQMRQVFRAGGTAPWPDLPLVVLVDNTTASAGEVLAGALQARDRTVIVGERTFGKGTVEQLISLDATRSALKLTTGEMRLPSGRVIQHHAGADVWGVDPTDGYYVPLTADERNVWLQRRGELEVVRGAVPVLPVTPQTARADLRDLPLAAAVEALEVRVTNGEFRPTGRPLAELTAETAHSEHLSRERDRLQQELQRVERELGE